MELAWSPSLAMWWNIVEGRWDDMCVRWTGIMCLGAHIIDGVLWDRNAALRFTYCWCVLCIMVRMWFIHPIPQVSCIIERKNQFSNIDLNLSLSSLSPIGEVKDDWFHIIAVERKDNLMLACGSATFSADNITPAQISAKLHLRKGRSYYSVHALDLHLSLGRWDAFHSPLAVLPDSRKCKNLRNQK
jgi:hypothetical protein